MKMNAIKNQSQLWYCDICERTINIKRKSKHITSKTHKHKQKYGIVVQEYELFTTDFDEVNYRLKDTIRDFRNK